jgi:hypothetical protein
MVPDLIRQGIAKLRNLIECLLSSKHDDGVLIILVVKDAGLNASSVRSVTAHWHILLEMAEDHSISLSSFFNLLYKIRCF